MKPAGGVPENAREKYATTCRDMHGSARNQDALPLPSQSCPDGTVNLSELRAEGDFSER